MSAALRKLMTARSHTLEIRHLTEASPHRAEVEAFIQARFAERYQARVSRFAPNLLLLKQAGENIAATGWRCAGKEELFLERYLDVPIESAMERLAGQTVRRARIVEVGHLVSQKAGASVDVILTLANHLDALGYEWVVFTATRELLGIFARLGLPLLALAAADPARLGAAAQEWGSYYDTEPVVVVGRVRLALERVSQHG